MPSVAANGIQIGYQIEGQGPPLLFLMGFTGARHAWYGFPQRFSHRFRVVTLDNRGVGESSAPPGPYSTAQMAADTLGLLDALGLPRVSLVGVSMGGMIAQHVASLAPERVERLVLGCSHHGGPSHVPPGAEALLRMSPGRRGGAHDTLRALVELNFSLPFLDAHPRLIEDMISHGLAHKMPHAGFLGQLAAVAGHDAAGQLGQIRCPTLVLTGSDDRLIPAANSALLAAAIPGARLATLPGVGHMFWVEAPDAAQAAIDAFLATPG